MARRLLESPTEDLVNCYVCAQSRHSQPAVGLCHNCSAGLCLEHAIEEPQDVIVYALINREVALPKRARQLLCGKCEEALHQRQRAV